MNEEKRPLGYDKMMLLSSKTRSNNCLTMHVEMAEAVDPGILRKAVDATMKRYSYLKVCLRKDHGGYYVKNENPIYVEDTTKAPVLGSEEVGGHLLAFTCHDQTIDFHFFHGLIDGFGVITILRTLIFYYCKNAFDSELDPGDIITLDTPVDSAENADPFLAHYEFENNIRKPAPVKGFRFSDSKLIKPLPSGSILSHIRVDARQLLSVCRENDASPAMLAMLMCSRVIAKHHPEAKNILGGISVSVRNAVGYNKTLKNAVLPESFLYDERLSKLPFSTQCTIFRGKTILLSDDDYLKNSVTNFQKLVMNIQKMPICALTFTILSKVFSKVMGDSYQVSYGAKVTFGSAEKYVKSLALDYNVPVVGFFVEMLSLGDNFYFDVSQSFRENIYINSLLDELHNLNIDAEILWQREAVTPGLKI